jgi:peptide/nickel transport system substrate-binding protein
MPVGTDDCVKNQSKIWEDHMKQYLRSALLAGGALILSSGAFTALAPHAAWAQEATFVLASDEVGAPTYNPIKAGVLNSATSLIYDRLVEQNADHSFHRHLADSWEVTDDGMAWTFHLHRGVKFHDGEPFNAQTIVWWISTFRGTDNDYMVDAIDKVEPIDDLTVKFVMKHPEPNLLYNLSSTFMGIPSPKAYQAAGDNYGVTTAVGTGPFKLQSFTVGQETVLTRNDDYAWASDLSTNQGPAKIKTLTFREIPEESTAFLELKTGNVDLLYGVPTDFLPKLKAEPSIAVDTIPGLDVFYMPINVTAAPFTDIKVRQATALAVNQKEILDNLYHGVGTEAHNFLISSLKESEVDPKFNISYDPEKAKQLLDEAGWKPGSDGIRVKDGKALEVNLWTQSDTEFKRMTEAVQAQLKAIGMQADITTFDSSTIRDHYKKNEHQLAVRSYEWDNADILDWFFSGERLGYPNISMWNDPKSEEMDKKALTGSKSWDDRVKNFTAYHEYLLSQFLFAPIYQPVQNLGYNKDHLQMPDKIRGTSLSSQSILDISVKD